MASIVEDPSNIKKLSYTISPAIWPNDTSAKLSDDEEYNEEEGPVFDFDNEYEDDKNEDVEDEKDGSKDDND